MSGHTFISKQWFYETVNINDEYGKKQLYYWMTSSEVMKAMVMIYIYVLMGHTFIILKILLHLNGWRFWQSTHIEGGKYIIFYPIDRGK